MPPDYDMTRQIGRNSMAKQFAGNRPALLLGAAAILALVAFGWWRRSRTHR
jgi:hypothetical protein